MKALQATLAICFAFMLAACSSSTSADKGVSPDPKPAAVIPVPKITLPSGTSIRVVLKDGVGTDTSSPGSEFSANLAEPIVVDGKTALAKGASVSGRVVDVKKSGRVKGRASLSLVLTSVVRDGKSIPIETKTYVGVAKSTKKRDVGIIGGAAGVGTAIGAIVGGKKGAATGAAVGGAGGTGAVLATRGADLHYSPEARLTFSLSKDVTL